MAARDLCQLSDVTAYAAGYTSDTATDTLLNRLIASESRSFHERTRREVAAISPAVNPRMFDVEQGDEARRRIHVGDLAVEPTTVRILDADGNVLEVVAAASYVSHPRNREEWQPIRWLRFPADVVSPVSNLIVGRVVEVSATAWGFPSVPADIREAVAAMVIARYVEIFPSGTAFSESLAEVNIAALFANAKDVERDLAALPRAA